MRFNIAESDGRASTGDDSTESDPTALCVKIRVILGTKLRASAREATNGAPPLARLLIHECLQVSHMLRLITLSMVLLIPPTALLGQEQSINPGINKNYQPPDLDDSIQRFESNGRDVFDHRQEIVTALSLKPGMTVADVGAGTGLFTRLFSPAVGTKGKVYAVDVSKEFVDHIEKLARQQHMDNIVGLACKQDSAELPAESVDLVFICDTYHHFEFPQKTMHSIYTALKPKGQLVLIDYRRVPGVSADWVLEHVRAGQEVFTQEIVDAGFQQIDEKKDLLKESYFVRFEKVSK
jgi:predicted methyltransferase